MPDQLAVAVLSLLAAITWGAGDFSGGIAARRADIFGVVAFAHAAGLAVMLALAQLWHEPWPTLHEFLWASAAGLSNGIAIAAFYRALAISKMGITAPIAAVITAVLPVIVGSAREGLPRSFQLAGFVLAMVAIWMIAKPEAGDGRPRGIGLAILAGLGFSGYLVLIRYSGSTSAFMSVALARLASLLLMFIIIMRNRRPWLPAPGPMWTAITAGIFDAIGGGFFLLAAQRGRLDVAAVLSSLYPASTVLLARIFLKEQLTLVQRIGITGALIAVPLIAAK
ncbi:MAG TPA: DMT family transporter [Terriglobales bacterium]